MFNRRKFLAGLVSNPAAALMAAPPTTLSLSQENVWAIVGVNREYNDEVNSPAGEFMTVHIPSGRRPQSSEGSWVSGTFRKQDHQKHFARILSVLDSSVSLQ
jgi:hypothetical protein